MSNQIPDAVVASWEDLLRRQEGQQKLLSEHHPLKIHFGDGDDGEPIFFVRSRTRPRKPEVSAAVQVVLGRRYDGEWALTFSLSDVRFKKTFMSLCWDLAQRSTDASSEEEALARFMSALGEWKRLLTFHDSDTLSEFAVRGLLAEMWFGFISGHIQAPADHIQDAWTGPMGSAQDFNFPQHSFEIKSVHADSATIRISSAEQLDVASSLDLVVVTLTEVPTPDNRSWTLRAVIDAVEQLHAGDLPSMEKLVRKLEHGLRVDKNNPYYAQHHYVPVSYTGFTVTADFPAIRASQLRTDVTDVSYNVKLAGLSEFWRYSSETDHAFYTPSLGHAVQ